MTSYNYKKPRSFNLVSMFLLLLVAAGVYGAWKFGPPYWKRYKVDEILNEQKNVAGELQYMNSSSRVAIENKVLGEVYRRIKDDVGIEDTEEQPLQVGFANDYSYLWVKYQIVVKHPFGKRTKLDVERRATVPKTRGL